MVWRAVMFCMELKFMHSCIHAKSGQCTKAVLFTTKSNVTVKINLFRGTKRENGIASKGKEMEGMESPPMRCI